MRLGIDIGGTKTAALVLDATGRIVAHVAAPSGRGTTRTLATAVDVANRAVASAGGWAHIEHVGACMPGSSTPTPGGPATPSTLASPPSTSPGASRRPPVAGPVSTTTSRPRPWEHITPCGRRSSRARRHTSTSAPGWRPRSSTGAGSSGCGRCGGRDRAPARGHRHPVLVRAGGVPGDHRLRERAAPDVAAEGPRAVPGRHRGRRAGAADGREPRARHRARRAGARRHRRRARRHRRRAHPRPGRAGVGPRRRHHRAGGDSPFLRRLDLVSRIRVLDGDVPVAAIGAALLPGTSEPVGAVV